MGFRFLSVNRKPWIFRKLLLYHKCMEIESCTACTLPAAWWTRGHFCGGNAGCCWLTAGCSQNFFLPHCCLLRRGAGNSKPYFLLGKLTCGVKASGRWHSSLHASANLASGVNYCGVRKSLCSRAVTQIKDKASLYTLWLLSLRKVKRCLQQTLCNGTITVSANVMVTFPAILFKRVLAASDVKVWLLQLSGM